MKIAFGYSRKSPDDEEDTKISLKNQDELINVVCKGKNWKIIKSFVDKNISGSDRERKGINDCIKESKKYKVSNPKEEVYIIVKDSKRFARDRGWLVDTIKDLNAYGVKVFSIIDNSFLDPSNLGYRIMADVDEQAIYDGQKNAKITQQLKMEKGLPCIPAPYGYKYGKNKSWIVDRKKAHIVKIIAERYLEGENFKETIKYLKVNKSLYYRILNNLRKGIYNGYVVFDKKVKGSGGKVVRVETIKYKSNFEPLISEETWRKVNERNM